MNKLMIALIITGVILLLLLLMWWQSTLNVAPSIRDRAEGFPLTPPPVSPDVTPSRTCLPGSGYTECKSKADCRPCSERPHGEYLDCLAPTYQEKITINGVPLKPDKDKMYCLPPQYNKCSPGFSNSVWKASQGDEGWQCECVPENYNLFTQATEDSDCTTELSCNRSEYKRCALDRSASCRVDKDCADKGPCLFVNRLISLANLDRATPCTLSPEDATCLPVRFSNYTTRTGEPFTGTGFPGDPLLCPLQKNEGLRLPAWDPLLDGPLFNSDSLPSWMSNSTNPDCKDTPLNPGCNVAANTWGGQCQCAEGLVSWKDYTTNPAISGVSEKKEHLAMFTNSGDRADYFGCIPDTCQVSEYISAGEGDPGPRLVTQENSKFLFSNKDGMVPLSLRVGTCWCGNIRKDNTGAYVSWIPYRPKNQPNYPPSCLRDPCNPDGYFDAMLNKCVCMGTSNVEGDGYNSRCVNHCESNICGLHGTCAIQSKGSETSWICTCENCWYGERCDQRKSLKGDACFSDADCCSQNCGTIDPAGSRECK